MEDDGEETTRYYILVDRQPVPASHAQYEAVMEQDPAQHTVCEDWLPLDDGQRLEEPHSWPDEAVACVATHFNGVGDEYHFFTALWTDAAGCCEQEALAGYTDWDHALVGHDLILRLLREGRLEPCAGRNGSARAA